MVEENKSRTKAVFAIAIPAAILIESVFALKLWQRWTDLKSDSFTGAYQAAAALLVGWPTIVFALAATYAAFISARASERQAHAADRQAVAADAQAGAARVQAEVAQHVLTEETRPVFKLLRVREELPWDSPHQYFYVENIGRGTAYEPIFEFHNRHRTDIPPASEMGQKNFVIVPGARAGLPAEAHFFTGILLFCTSILGNIYCYRFSLTSKFYIMSCVELTDMPEISSIDVNDFVPPNPA